MTAPHADPIALQHRLFAELSRMFGAEVPLYDTSLLVNRVCNTAVCELLADLHVGFSVTEDQIDRDSAERHGAIRIGRPDEFRWIARFFARFAMQPVNFYDMTDVGEKSQPIIATAFRSTIDPQHRIFASLLQTSYFDEETRGRIEALLATREVFSPRAKSLIERGEADGGLSEADATALIEEAATRIFKWTGRARDHQLYTDLSDAGFKIAADIACFESHHLNHLTPNTFCMDLYTAGMKHALGVIDADDFRRRATRALEIVAAQASRDWLILHFKHLEAEAIDAFAPGELAGGRIDGLVDGLMTRFRAADLDLSDVDHHGFKDHTEGPSVHTLVLLRQDAYRALTERVVFVESDGRTIEAAHTARFGEIEQRFYVPTQRGRDLYDTCLLAANAARDERPAIEDVDPAAYEALYAAPFAAFPATLPELLAAGLVFCLPRPTAAGRKAAADGTIRTTDLAELDAAGFVRRDGLRYEDFLPISAAGIFASNLQQYGTRSTASVKPTYQRSMLEDLVGGPIDESIVIAASREAAATLDTYRELGLLERLPAERRAALDAAIAAWPAAGEQRRLQTSAG